MGHPRRDGELGWVGILRLRKLIRICGSICCAQDDKRVAALGMIKGWATRFAAALPALLTRGRDDRRRVVWVVAQILLEWFVA